MTRAASPGRADVLEVRGLHTHFLARGFDNQVRVARALNGVDFTVGEREIVGLVGETGAGKSLTAYSVMGLLKPPAKVVAGQALYNGRDLLALSDDERRKLRGGEIALVVQSPKSSLEPLTTVSQQLVRVHRAHRQVDEAAARVRAVEMLAAVGIPDPERRANAYAHQLSGGMAQRVLMAMALINEPKLLIADEPTTGLDVTVQAQVLDLLRDLVRARGMSALVITHDLGIVAQYCDRIAVMYAGQVVESGDVMDVFARPSHPYTRRLIASTPDSLARRGGRPLGGAANPPNLYALPDGCLYADRCDHAAAQCAVAPRADPVAGTHLARCHFSRLFALEPMA